MSDPLFDLSGRVAVVTGGMGQLGAEVSVALATRWMRVAILDVERVLAVGLALLHLVRSASSDFEKRVTLATVLAGTGAMLVTGSPVALTSACA